MADNTVTKAVSKVVSKVETGKVNRKTVTISVDIEVWERFQRSVGARAVSSTINDLIGAYVEAKHDEIVERVVDRAVK